MTHNYFQLKDRVAGCNLLNIDQNLIGHKDISSFTLSFVSNIKEKNILVIGFGCENLCSQMFTAGLENYQIIDLKQDDFRDENNHFTDSIINMELNKKIDKYGQFFDVIIMNEVIEYIPIFKMELVLEELKQILKPGGHIVLSISNCNNPYEDGHGFLSFNSSGIHGNKETVDIDTLLKTCLKHNFICSKADKRFFGFVRRSDIKHFAPPKKNNYLDKYIPSLSKDKRHAKPDKETGRLMIGCVTENNAKYQRQTLNLVKSIRWFGGKMAGADIFVCIVDEADDEFVLELKKWGAFVRIVKRFSEHHPQSNKLRFFELPEIDFYDTIMFLDCDTIIVQDPLKYIDGKSFQAEMAAGATVPHELFKEIFYHYQLKVPERTYKTALSRISTIWYCNAGVLIFPKSILQTFFPVWREYTEDLIKNKHLLKDYFKFCEQASLTLSFVKNPVPFKKLPMKMNFPLVGRYAPEIQQCDPVIIHYHHRSEDSGFILEVTKSHYAQKRIKEFNQMLKKYGN
ncbi:methyltransferase domain-containing protein [Cytobacillus sp. NJ13]|nr:methyltransferase domain-containing protein [Cytobacillus sp. NJ13]